MFMENKNLKEHYNIIEETSKYIVLKCKATGESYKVYKNTFPKNFTVCKSCGEKIYFNDIQAANEKKYTKMLENYLDGKRDLTFVKLLHKTRNKANVPYEEFRELKYRNRIPELNAGIIFYNQYKKDIAYESPEYRFYNSKKSSIRKLFNEIKDAVPDFAVDTTYIEYRDKIIKEYEKSKDKENTNND